MKLKSLVESLRDNCKHSMAYEDIAQEMIAPSVNCTIRIYLHNQTSH